MNIKQLIMVASAAVVSFGGAFVAAWVTRPGPAAATELNTVQPELQRFRNELGIQGQTAAQTQEQQRSELAQEQVRNLVAELKDKIRQYQEKLKELDLRQQRMDVVWQQVNEEIKRLEDLRVEIATAVAALKAERDQLEQAQVKISQNEQANLKVLAATYDKMDPDSAAKLLVSMCKARASASGRAIGVDDAVKITYYMNDKKRASVLGSMIQADPDIAAYLTLRLKQVAEE